MEIDHLASDFRKRWSGRASPSLIDRALKQAENWTDAQLNWIAPNDRQLQEKVRPNVFKRGIENLAENWIKQFANG